MPKMRHEMQYLCDEYIYSGLCRKLRQSGHREMQSGILAERLQQVFDGGFDARRNQRPVRVLNHHFIATAIVLPEEQRF